MERTRSLRSICLKSSSFPERSTPETCKPSSRTFCKQSGLDNMGPPLGPSGKCCGNGGFLVDLLPARRNGQDRSLRSPFRSPSKPAHPDEIRTIEQFPRRGGPMCPPSRGNFHPHPTQANSHHLETHPIVTHAKQIRTAHHGRTHGSAPNANRLRGEQPEREAKENIYPCKLRFIDDFWAPVSPCRS